MQEERHQRAQGEALGLYISFGCRTRDSFTDTVWLWVAIVIICVILAFAETSPIAAIIFVVVFGLVVSIPYGLKAKPYY